MSWRIIDGGELTYTAVGYPRPDTRRRFVVLGTDDGRPPIAVVTEGEHDPGVSVTNAVEAVRGALVARLGTPSFRLVEHYQRSVTGTETFDAVFFTDTGAPRWKPLAARDRSRAALVALVDGDTALVDAAVPPSAGG